MNKFLTPKELKNEFDPYYKLDISVYEKLTHYLPKRIYRRSVILKNSGEVEKCARYVYKGTLAMLYPSESGRDYRVKIFKAGRVAVDLQSYMKQNPSPYIIKTLDYSTILELQPDGESDLLDKLPEVNNLSTVINQAIAHHSEEWAQIFTLPLKEGLKLLSSEQFKVESSYLSIKDKSYLFKCSVSKITRTMKELGLLKE
ncbi:hypothetical protein [Echinicola sp. 20G]|uniref:hypothetical protein n=1 Tax=Echinicola sp. 20G TaxID=2781961 RepID=UPI001910E8D1|nr:hypothetical protein [Echinicola sp. 20G]